MEQGKIVKEVHGARKAKNEGVDSWVLLTEYEDGTYEIVPSSVLLNFCPVVGLPT